MKIVLVRHGYTIGNDLGTYTGWSDTKLSEKGIEELHEYRETYAYPKTDRYYTSDLVRTIDTFKLIYGDETPINESSPAFREIHFGDYEDIRWDQIDNIPYNEVYIRNQPHVNGETISQVALRIFGKLNAILDEMVVAREDSLTIVCHSGIVKTFLMFLAPLSFDTFREIATPNGLGYIMDVDYDVVNKLVTMNNYIEIPKK
ncbi:histidine phosphatase family protein [Erysipelothrix sp. HDW6C]|uniref:histidine phosphatase family protein n=1 Tax=Erysipelothrix sp. HDW6C TaxID=2714930 RepID=UPI001409F662|nr:histidine phosphatase family protein [Erysipelothrix sp. HDW6C]QIK69059.1 histidine phosphatase family protein [Erysipelothrix sp. HDW6C]